MGVLETPRAAPPHRYDQSVDGRLVHVEPSENSILQHKTFCKHSERTQGSSEKMGRV